MQPPLPCPTPTWHNDTYAAISPSRPELSAKGKTVIVTGAGSGIGRATALAFAQAGARKVVLVGRTLASLEETKGAIPAGETTCTVHAVSVADEKAMAAVAASVGVWDVLVLAAGFTAEPGPVSESPIDEWWQSFETNVKGGFVSVKVFLPSANPTHSTILGVTSCAVSLPVAMLPGLSAYASSKLAQVKFLEFLAAENPNIFVATLHPGCVETLTFLKSGAKADQMPMDTVQLPAHFMLWLSSPEAAFLKGRSVWANWDVEELMSQAQGIQAGLQMTSGILGWPYTSPSQSGR